MNKEPTLTLEQQEKLLIAAEAEQWVYRMYDPMELEELSRVFSIHVRKKIKALHISDWKTEGRPYSVDFVSLFQTNQMFNDPVPGTIMDISPGAEVLTTGPKEGEYQRWGNIKCGKNEQPIETMNLGTKSVSYYQAYPVCMSLKADLIPDFRRGRFAYIAERLVRQVSARTVEKFNHVRFLKESLRMDFFFGSDPGRPDVPDTNCLGGIMTIYWAGWLYD